jgi:iron complex transport system substrate-binding protein
MLKWAIVLLTLFCTSIAYACDVQDDAGHRVHLTKPAKRIISLAPDMTELLFAAGAGDAVVGVMKGSDYPLAAKKLPIVANYNLLNIEAILGLHPDLIVAWSGGMSATQRQQIQSLGIPVFFSDQHAITDIPQTLKKLGCLAGTENIANHAAVNFSKEYEQLAQRYSQQSKLTVFYEMWHAPLMTAGPSSWIHQIITLCGGKNIFANAVGAAPQVNIEAVLAANPEGILGSASKVQWQLSWQQWPTLTAVKKQQIYTVPADWLERAGPRLILGAKAVCEDLSRARVGAS